MNSIRDDVPRSAALAGVLATLCLTIMPVHAGNIIEEWSQVKAPPPPALQAVRIAPASTALIVMDLSTKTCTKARWPRCVPTLPSVARLVREARASGVLVLYSLIGHDGRNDIPSAFAARPSDTVLTGAGPDKFLGTDLGAILKDKHIKTLITVGSLAEGAVLNTASAAALRGLHVIVPVDGMSSNTLFGEQSTVWYLAHAPRVSQHTELTTVRRIRF